jgi:hypothetical protein
MRNLRLASILFSSGLAVLAFSSAAQAATFTLGNPLTAQFFSPGECSDVEGCAAALLDVSDPGAQAVAPVDGTIERWRVAGASETPGYQLNVLRPEGEGVYTVTASSAPVEPEGNFIETFATSLPIHAGELIALNFSGEIGIYETPSTEAIFSPPLQSGETRAASFEEDVPFELGFNADVSTAPTPLVILAPTIAAIAPASGSFEGGTAVTITGSNLGAATAVSFGGVTTSFRIVSPSQITAITPRLQPRSFASIAITTPGGTATSPSAYTATACLVPKLSGKKLKAAKKALRSAECRIGEVKKLEGATAKTGKVSKQNRKPGTFLPLGAKVNVKLRG